MDFLITALDYTDENALERRMQARTEHLANAKELHKSGNLIAAGAILSDEGKMIGSTLYLRFDSEEELKEYLDNDPYTKGKVWEKIETQNIKLVQFD
ncbi:YciI family protein [Chondrinema litorale]|uniref:YciI family protein n=1 Tax=Chondrinema litorale TaxID=2994555 RepID=UPI00254347B9|nr:YciI family protein [Chondrinema litorale]UZR93040.1 YciI family protein [Chondrinema litorale]